MNANLSQLLKDFKQSPMYVNLLACILGCALIFYAVFLYFSSFFQELTAYEQALFALGFSIIYTGISVPVSCFCHVKYPQFFYFPILMLSIISGVSIFTPLAGWTSIPGKKLMLILPVQVYSLAALIGWVHALYSWIRQKSGN